MLPLFQAREQFVHVVLAFADFGLGVEEPAHVQVLFHRQPREHPPAFRHNGNAGTHDVGGGFVGDIAAFQNDPAGAGLRVAANGHQQGGLAGAVGTDQGDNFALVHLHRHPVQGLDLAVVGMNVFQY